MPRYPATYNGRRTVARLAVGIVCFILLALLIAKVIAPQTSDANWTSIAATPLDAISDQASENPRSTPQSEWMRGRTPYLYQKDPQWASREYADGTIGTHGCGPTALTMAYIRLTGKTDADPAKMAQFAERCGFVDNGLTSWLLMSQGAEMLGLSSRMVPASTQAVREELLADNQVICSVHQGDFTSDGHFILLCDLNRDGTVEIRDPSSESRTAQAWDLDRVISQCDNIWSLSAHSA